MGRRRRPLGRGAPNEPPVREELAPREDGEARSTEDLGQRRGREGALAEEAKRAPSYCFYTLYDKIYRPDVLWAAYRRCRRTGGDPGVDGQTFDQIEAEGVEQWIDELAEALRTKAYEPEPVRRVWIEKEGGKERPLGIPTVRDRVVQTAALIVLAPIFEADLQPEQYAYRPGRSAHDALRHVHRLLQSGYTEVVDADLKDTSTRFRTVS